MWYLLLSYFSTEETTPFYSQVVRFLATKPIYPSRSFPPEKYLDLHKRCLQMGSPLTVCRNGVIIMHFVSRLFLYISACMLLLAGHHTSIQNPRWTQTPRIALQGGRLTIIVPELLTRGTQYVTGNMTSTDVFFFFSKQLDQQFYAL